MGKKCIKISSSEQLQVLVDFMEANPEFARGTFGSSKLSMENQWANLTQKLNSHGPPVRTVLEWKKTWTDLISRTTEKLAKNNKSLSEAGDDMNQVNALSELEQVLDRTLLLSKAVAPVGKVFGLRGRESPKKINPIESFFTQLVDTPPPICSKAVAVVIPSRQNDSAEQMQQPTQQSVDLSPFLQHNMQHHKRQLEGVGSDLPNCSSSKKRKSGADEQIGLIRRQLRLVEQSADIAKQHSDAAVMLVEATKDLKDAAKRIADAAEVQAVAAKSNIEIEQKIILSLKKMTMVLAENIKKLNSTYKNN